MNGVFKKFKVTRKRKYEKEREDIETEFRQPEKKRLGKKVVEHLYRTACNSLCANV